MCKLGQCTLLGSEHTQCSICLSTTRVEKSVHFVKVHTHLGRWTLHSCKYEVTVPRASGSLVHEVTAPLLVEMQGHSFGVSVLLNYNEHS